MRAAAYLRVSSASQSTAMQRARIRAVSKARGDTIVRWHSEKQSARKLERPELDQVRALARQGEVRKLYVYRLDRLTRSGIRDTLTLLDEFRSHGCTVVTCDDGFTLDEGPARDVVVACLAWAAQMERLAISERISAARAGAETWGRPRRVTAMVQREILRMSGEELASIRQIAVALKVPKSTVAAVVSGKPPYGDMLIPSRKRGLTH